MVHYYASTVTPPQSTVSLNPDGTLTAEADIIWGRPHEERRAIYRASVSEPGKWSVELFRLEAGEWEWLDKGTEKFESAPLPAPPGSFETIVDDGQPVRAREPMTATQRSRIAELLRAPLRRTPKNKKRAARTRTKMPKRKGS